MTSLGIAIAQLSPHRFVLSTFSSFSRPLILFVFKKKQKLFVFLFATHTQDCIKKKKKNLQ
jgi:hypothetical protein